MLQTERESLVGRQDECISRDTRFRQRPKSGFETRRLSVIDKVEDRDAKGRSRTRRRKEQVKAQESGKSALCNQ
jgi:hypothetical protein